MGRIRDVERSSDKSRGGRRNNNEVDEVEYAKHPRLDSLKF